MKKKTISAIVVCFLLVLSGFAQRATSFEDEIVKDGQIYLIYDDNTLEYFTREKTPNGRATIQDSITLSLKDDNACNIYLKWINPLKYRLIWKEVTYSDERDQAINDFISKLVSQFGSAVTSLNKKDISSRSEQATNQANMQDIKGLKIPKDGFININLNLLYLQLRSNRDTLSDTEINNINKLTYSLIELDYLNSLNISKDVDSIFKDLLEINNPDDVQTTIDSKRSDIEKLKDIFNAIESLQKSLTKTLSELTIRDKLLNSSVKSVVGNFIGETKVTLINNKNLTSKLDPVIKIVENSVKDESEIDNLKGYFRTRNVSFEEGKKLETSLSVAEYEYNNDTKEFTRKKEMLNNKLIFQKYDFVSVSVSAGLFFSNSTLKGFGVSGTSTGQFTVSEDDISENKPVAALFMNFSFGRSRYLSPIVQLGIDPTKKRPFLLAGIGIMIPSGRFAISGGPLWTWNPELDKLTVGQTISSTTALDKDIDYKFSMEPKGWYLGIQYNF